MHPLLWDRRLVKIAWRGLLRLVFFLLSPSKVLQNLLCSLVHVLAKGRQDLSGFWDTRSHRQAEPFEEVLKEKDGDLDNLLHGDDVLSHAFQECEVVSRRTLSA